MSAFVGRVLVTDGARSSALAMIRSLARAGWHVTAADVEGSSPGLSSRFAAHRLRYTSPGRDARRFVDDLVAETKRNRVDLLIPVTDNAILPLANARERFSPTTVLALPDNHALELARDKLQTVTLARDLGVPVPATVFASTVAEAVAVLRGVGPPVVLKPRFSRQVIDNRVVSSQVSYAFDAADVAHAFNQAQAPGGFLVQEYTPGTGVGVELLLDEGKPLLMFQHRRIREVPLTGGPSSLRESVALDPVLGGYAGAILGRMQWTGLAMVEFKLTTAGPRLMEVNGRVWGSLPLAVACGIDFPAALAHLLTGRGAVPVSTTTYPTGVRRRNLELELAWIAAAFSRNDDSRLGVPTGTSPWRVLLSIPASLGEIDTYEPNDVRPLAVELLRIGELIWRRIRKSGRK
jgi:predicted ATP-grasp superfamily ATP-dependent carboligase